MFTEKEVVFISKEGAKFKITESAFILLQSYIQKKKGDHESGGVLLGRYIADTKDVVVDMITTPQLNDKSTPTTFFKNKEEHQEIIDKVWKESKGTCNYLGEWHTHPQYYPLPSSIDINTWYRLTKEIKFEFESLFFVIVGRKEICVYKTFKKNSDLQKLIWQKKKKEENISPMLLD